MGASTGVPIARFGRADVPDGPDSTDLGQLGVDATPPAGRRARRTLAGARPAPVPDRSSSLTWIVLVGGLVVAIALDRPGPRRLHRRVGAVHPRRRPDHDLRVGRCRSSSRRASRSSARSAGSRAIAPIYAAATLYVSLVRGTPLIVQIFFIYLALPQFGIVLPALVGGIFALAFNYGAYMTEIFRAGIQAIPRGQLEAAAALGMTERMTMRRIVLPQAVRIVIPAIGNEFIAMIKDSALVVVRRHPGAVLAGQHRRARGTSGRSRRCSSRRSSTGS